MSVITCYNRVRQVPTDSGVCLVEVLSMFGQSVAYNCTLPFDCVQNWVTMDAVDVETTADRVIEVYHYGNGYVSCSDRTREYIGTFVAGIPTEQCTPAMCVYAAQIGSLNVWSDPNVSSSDTRKAVDTITIEDKETDTKSLDTTITDYDAEETTDAANER